MLLLLVLYEVERGFLETVAVIEYGCGCLRIGLCQRWQSAKAEAILNTTSLAHARANCVNVWTGPTCTCRWRRTKKGCNGIAG